MTLSGPREWFRGTGAELKALCVQSPAIDGGRAKLKCVARTGDLPTIHPI
jgi:hypothetical protein